MIICLAGGFSSSSDTLKTRLEKSLNVKSMTFKAGSGIGHLNINIRIKKNLLIKFYKLIGKNIIIDQHLFPTKYCMEILDSLFGIDKIKFIVTYRNIYDTINNILKRKHSTNSFHMFRSNFYPTYQNFISEKYGINVFDVLCAINFYAMWFKIEQEKYIKNIEFVSFEDNTRNVDLVNKKLSNFLGIDLSLDPNIKANLFKKHDHNISNELREFVKEYAASFHDVDFSRIGL